MITVSVVGSPEMVCSYVESLISGGAVIHVLEKTRNNATYIIAYDNGVPPSGDFLLLENGDFLLLESGDKILLE